MQKTNAIKKLCAVAMISIFMVSCGDVEEKKQKYMEQGKALYKEARYEKALLAFKNILQIDPKDSEGRYQLAETLSKQGDIKKAFAHYNVVKNADSTHVMSRVRIGQLYLMSREIERAETMVKEVLVLAPDDTEVLVFQATFYLLQNNIVEATQSIEKVLKNNNTLPSAIILRASIYIKIGDIEQAVELLKQGVVSTPDNESMHIMLAQLYEKQQLSDEVERELKQLIEIKPESLKHYHRLVRFYLIGNYIDKAESVCRVALNRMPDNEMVQLYLIDFIAKKKGLGHAVDEISKLLSQFPEAYYLYFKLADLQIGQKNLPAAELALQQVIDMDRLEASGIKARNSLAKLYSLTKRGEQAKALIKVVLTENPRDAEALMLRGQFALASKQLSEAIADFRSALTGQPNNIKLLKLLSSAQVANNDIELALDNMQKVVNIEPTDEKARKGVVQLLFRSGKPLQAETHVLALLELSSKNNFALEHLYKIRMLQKEWDQALVIAEKIRVDAKDAVKGYYFSGLVYQAKAQWQESIQAFKQVLSLNEEAIEPLTQLVKSYLLFDQSDKAILYLTQVVKEQPDYFVAHNLLGEVLLRDKQFNDAEKAFQQAISLKPEWEEAYRNLALLYMINKDKIAAKKILQVGVDKTKSNLQLIEILVAIYKKEGQVDQIIKLYDMAYLHHPESDIVINNLAGYLAEYGVSQEDIDRAEEISRPLEQSENPNILDTVAWIAYKQGKYDKAQKIFELVIESGEVYAEIYYHIGMVYYKQGDNALAEVYLKKAIIGEEKYTGVEQAKDILQEIGV